MLINVSVGDEKLSKWSTYSAQFNFIFYSILKTSNIKHNENSRAPKTELCGTPNDNRADLLTKLYFPVKEEHRTAFFGEDIHIDIPAGDVGEVVFRPKTNKSVEVPLLRAGKVVHRRARLNPYGHLVLDDVQEEDEGVYVVSRNESVLRRLTLDVRGKQQQGGKKWSKEFTSALYVYGGFFWFVFVFRLCRGGSGQVRRHLLHPLEPGARSNQLRVQVRLPRCCSQKQKPLPNPKP